MKDSDITLTPTAKLVEMTKALPVIPNGSYPLVYEQIIINASEKSDAMSGKPDPAHID